MAYALAPPVFLENTSAPSTITSNQPVALGVPSLVTCRSIVLDEAVLVLEALVREQLGSELLGSLDCRVLSLVISTATARIAHKWATKQISQPRSACAQVDR